MSCVETLVLSVPQILHYNIRGLLKLSVMPSLSGRSPVVPCSTGSFSMGLFHRFVHVSVRVFAHGSPEHVCYVLSTDGTSCIVTTVEPLVVLKCSPLICSMLLRSTRGMRNPFSEGVLELDCMMLPLAELGPRLLMAIFVCVVVEDVFFLGLVELPVSILFAWVLLSQIITKIYYL